MTTLPPNAQPPAPTPPLSAATTGYVLVAWPRRRRGRGYGATASERPWQDLYLIPGGEYGIPDRRDRVLRSKTPSVFVAAAPELVVARVRSGDATDGAPTVPTPRHSW